MECAGACKKRQCCFQNSTRPSLCSEAAPVRFSNSRIAAKSLPMPEEFPEQHSRSFPNCFETTLCLYFNKALSGQVTATGLAPDINWKHMCFAVKNLFPADTHCTQPVGSACLVFATVMFVAFWQQIWMLQSFSSPTFLEGVVGTAANISTVS